MTKPLKLPIQRREADGCAIEIRAGDDGRKRLRFPASSEAPVERFYGDEVLSHDKGAIRLDRANRGVMPLLFNHNWDDPIGMVESASVEDKRMVVDAVLFDTARGKEVGHMIDQGLRNVSIGYRIHTVEEDAKRQRYTARDWSPFEVSIVSVPADASVGVGRAEDVEAIDVRVISETTARPADKETAMTDQVNASAGASADVRSSNVTALELDGQRTRAIENLCKANKIGDDVRQMWVTSGASIDKISDDLLQILKQRGEQNPQSVAKLGLSEAETKKFSILRAIKAVADKNWATAGFEAECSREIGQRLGKIADPNKFYVPFEVQQDKRFAPNGSGRRDLTVGTAGAGGYLVATDNVGFIDILRNRSVAMRMGAQMLPGLQGNVTIPRQSVASTAYWLSTEATGITESQPTFVQITLAPKNVGGYTEISRQLLLQSSPGVEAIVNGDLAAQVALAVDSAALNGSGASGQPTGIINTAGIGGVTGTSIDYAKVLEFQTDVAGNNVMPVRGGYVTTPAVAALLMQRVKFSGTASPLWEGNVWDGSMCGYPGMTSLQVPAANALFGDWSELIIGEWGVLEVEVNPYANFAAGIIGVRAMHTVDVALRRPFAFSLATAIT